MQVPFTDLANLLYLPPIFQLFLCEGTAVAHLTIDNPFFQVAFSIFSGDKLFFFSSAVPGVADNPVDGHERVHGCAGFQIRFDQAAVTDDFDVFPDRFF